MRNFYIIIYICPCRLFISAEPDEMSHLAAFYVGFQYLQKKNLFAGILNKKDLCFLFKLHVSMSLKVHVQYEVVLNDSISVCIFIFFHHVSDTLCMRVAKTLARLRICTASPEPSADQPLILCVFM